MPAGQLYINGKDAFNEWGVSLDSQGLSTLMTPNGLKDYVSDESRLDNGHLYVVGDFRVQERQFSLTFNLIAKNEIEFFEKYNSFCQEIENGVLDIETSFQEEVVYHCLYVSCTQFTQFMRGIAQFSLKLIEPNPAYRTPQTMGVVVSDYGTVLRSGTIRLFEGTTFTLSSVDGSSYRWVIDGQEAGTSAVTEEITKGEDDIIVTAYYETEFISESIRIEITENDGTVQLDSLTAVLSGTYPEFDDIVS